MQQAILRRVGWAGCCPAGGEGLAGYKFISWAPQRMLRLQGKEGRPVFNPHTPPGTRATAGDRAPAKMGQGQHHPSLGNGKHGMERGGVPPCLVYICLAGTLTDQRNKQKGGFREGGGVCLWDNHSGGWGEGHEGCQQYSFRSKGHRKERLPSVISGETSGGSLTFVSYLFMQYSPTASLDAPMCLEGGAGARRAQKRILPDGRPGVSAVYLLAIERQT